jgi:ABC-type nitrate/sulfonate/bicarbonate transport system permease component
MHRRHRIKVRVVQAIAAALLLGAWLFFTIGPAKTSPLILPPIWNVAKELGVFFTSPDLYWALFVTLMEMVAALTIAIVAGVGVGFWAARSKFRSLVMEPLLIWSYLVPFILFYPLLLLWLGFGSESKIGYAALSAFFPIAFNALRAFSSVDDKYIRMGRAFGASRRQLDLRIKFRAGIALAGAGIRLGIATGVVTVITAEMLASTQGLGYLIRRYSESFVSAKTYGIIIIVILVVAVIYFVIHKLLGTDRKATPRS